MTISTPLRAAFAPTGRLRAAINLGNPILANRDTGTGRMYGVSVDLAVALARRLDVGLELVEYDAAGKSVEGVARGNADIGFFAVDPTRATDIAFTAPYVLIEGCYLVPESSSILDNDEVDRPGRVVVVGKGSAYDLYLSRELRQATIVRSPTSPTVVDTFLAEKADVAAGVKQQLQADAQRVGRLRLLPGRFMLIRQAMGMARLGGPEAAAYLAAFVEEAKASGLVSEALLRHRIQGASVAPAA
jgi:polar amino acid transport system substrate-binding protein